MDMQLALPAVRAGEVSSAVVEVGSLAGGGAVELVCDELPPGAREAGWAVEPLKLSAAAGAVQKLTVKYAHPAAAGAARSGQVGLADGASLVLRGTIKGGTPAVGGGPAGRRFALVCTCQVAAPRQL
jgi:hypothetical protein